MDKRKRALIISLLVLIITITIVVIGYFSYKYYLYSVCLKDQSFLDYEVVNVIEEDGGSKYLKLSNDNFRIFVEDNYVSVIGNYELNYVKSYYKGVLKDMMITENKFKHFLAIINPFPVLIADNEYYHIRTKEEIDKLLPYIDEKDKYYMDDYLVIDLESKSRIN